MKIAILTNFKEFDPGYSLTGIVQDQWRMLLRYGHEVGVFVAKQFSHKFIIPPDLPWQTGLSRVVPHPILIDYASKKDLTKKHERTVQSIAKMLKSRLSECDFVYTHDWVSTGWNLPYALAIQQASQEMLKTKWLHWIHSIPSGLKDWWNIRRYGPRHRLVYPNKTDRTRVAEQFRGKRKQVVVIPHIKDLRSWFEFDSETCRFIDDFPGVMQADIVQIYPAGSDRLEQKRLREVILIFKYFKKMGFDVCLVCANQYARKAESLQLPEVDHYMRIAKRNGLKIQKEFVFTSKWGDKYELGIPKRMLRELLQLSNIFIYPTREESFGLVAVEAALAGGVELVLNKSLDMMLEVHGMTALYCDFGGFDNPFKPKVEREYYEALALLFLGRMREQEAINTKTFHRQNHNWDAVYKNHYGPVMHEAQTWSM